MIKIKVYLIRISFVIDSKYKISVNVLYLFNK